MKRNFFLTPEAKDDLRDILFDIAEDNPETAARLRSEFYKTFMILGRSSGIGHYHEELMDRRFRFWNFYSYVVCYLWEFKPIQIVAVVHGARDLAGFFDLRSSFHEPESSA